MTTKEERKLRKHLKRLTNDILLFLDALDKEMKKPSTSERGKRIAKLCNSMDMENDEARYFGLGVDFRRDNKERIVARLIKKYTDSLTERKKSDGART